MSKEQFLAKLAEIMEMDGGLTGTEELSDLEGWDSMAVLSFIAMVDEETGKTVSVQNIANAKTVQGLYELVAP